MKHILLIYAFVSLLAVALLSVLSYDAGPGYVYILWHGIQVQTNLWIMLLAAIMISLSLQMAWLLLKRSVNRAKRQQQFVTQFSALHPYEQLGVIWMLDGANEQKQAIQQLFDQSGLLKNMIQAHLLTDQQQYQQALEALDHCPPAAFELAELLRIRIHLEQQDAAQALTHLEFLNGHALSPWMTQIEQSVNQQVTVLWEQFALAFPWQYLQSGQYGQLSSEVEQHWLTQLLALFDRAEEADLVLLKQRYAEYADQHAQQSYPVKKLWLKILTRFAEMDDQHQQLALQMLKQQFDQEVFYLWFQQQLLKPNPDYTAVEQQISQLEQQYPGMPVFAFAKWHIYTATERMAEAEQLLSLYPDNIQMNYLRIKSTLQNNDALIQQLNSIYEKDTNFIQLKI